jgi:hypothetical protein
VLFDILECKTRFVAELSEAVMKDVLVFFLRTLLADLVCGNVIPAKFLLRRLGRISDGLNLVLLWLESPFIEISLSRWNEMEAGPGLRIKGK